MDKRLFVSPVSHCLVFFYPQTEGRRVTTSSPQDPTLWPTDLLGCQISAEFPSHWDFLPRLITRTSNYIYPTPPRAIDLHHLAAPGRLPLVRTLRICPPPPPGDSISREKHLTFLDKERLVWFFYTPSALPGKNALGGLLWLACLLQQ